VEKKKKTTDKRMGKEGRGSNTRAPIKKHSKNKRGRKKRRKGGGGGKG